MYWWMALYVVLALVVVVVVVMFFVFKNSSYWSRDYERRLDIEKLKGKQK